MIHCVYGSHTVVCTDFRWTKKNDGLFFSSVAIKRKGKIWIEKKRPSISPVNHRLCYQNGMQTLKRLYNIQNKKKEEDRKKLAPKFIPVNEISHNSFLHQTIFLRIER